MGGLVPGPSSTRAGSSRRGSQLYIVSGCVPVSVSLAISRGDGQMGSDDAFSHTAPTSSPVFSENSRRVSYLFPFPFQMLGVSAKVPREPRLVSVGRLQSSWVEGAGQQPHPHMKASDRHPLSLQVWLWVWALGPWPRSPRRASALRTAQVSWAFDREGRVALGGGPASPQPPPGSEASRDLTFHLQGCDHLCSM